MASLGKDFHLRPFDSIVKELGILYRRELVIRSAQDERGKGNFSLLVHQVESITSEEIAIEDFRPASEHLSDFLFNKHRRNVTRVYELIHLSNGLLKIVLDPIEDHGKNLQPCSGSH